MGHRLRALSCCLIHALLLLLLLHGPGRVAELAVAAEYSSKTDLDYEFGDYRGKWCIDDHGFVYGIGEIYYPSPTACPCTCTVEGPVCVRPKCRRIHPQCTRIRYKACCPVCEAMARVCVYRGKTYRLLEEFRLSRCERCRCEANREVYCTISDCPAPHCVNPTYEPNHCCPVCKAGPLLDRQSDRWFGEPLRCVIVWFFFKLFFFSRRCQIPSCQLCFMEHGRIWHQMNCTSCPPADWCW
ncbi:von Willebrand factor C domain-containing protein 2-like [Scomber scombrus]|uniref:von Willebrand factor C domain-containing protein 2-like n=1 Tax=Scomber scombrus TaxID=13677 RepID=A0AAV1Q542_SCOSC